jgi:hypothetical protein
MPFILLAALVLYASSCTTEPTRHGLIDAEVLLRRYHDNRQKPLPIVTYVGNAKEVLLYPDGLFMVTDEWRAEGQPSRWLAVRLSPTQMTNLIAGLCAKEGFWKLENRYVLARGYDLPVCNVSLRIPGRPEKRVGVIGWLSGGSAPFVLKERLGDGKPPKEFADFVDDLTRIRPEGLQVWDPGYVEVEFSDYSYALGTLKWPADWPSLRSPLVHEKWGSKIMIFPSELVTDLDGFLAKRSDYTAVLIGGWKTAVGYRWPLPGENE